MSSQQTYSDTISAADKSIGFDFQYYYFLNSLLNIGKGESVGLEVKDDVHTDLKNNRQILVQVKHSIQKSADGKPKNITTYDVDLWKTLFNWSKVVSDAAAGRDTLQAQIYFARRTTFCLASNKNCSKSNKFFDILNSLQEEKVSIAEARSSIEKLRKGTTDKDIIKYIEAVLSLKDKPLEVFLLNVIFEQADDDIIATVKDSITVKMVKAERVESVFASLDSEIRKDNFIDIKNGKSIIISFDDFHRKYRRHFDIANSPKLLIDDSNIVLPPDLKDQTFIVQLCDIGDIKFDNHEKITNFTRCKIKLTNNLESWHQSGEITGKEKSEFHDEARGRWENKYHSQYREEVDTSSINQKALAILDQMRCEKLCVDTTDLPIDMCNGEYYHLSDIPEIGWHKDWDTKYKK